jgi:hypothetical protein
MTTQPKVTVSAASGYKNLVFGGEVAYSIEKSAVSNYGLALGLHAGDSQLAVHLQVGTSEGKDAVAVSKPSGVRLGLNLRWGLYTLMGGEGWCCGMQLLL